MTIGRLGTYLTLFSCAALLMAAGCGKDKNEEPPKPAPVPQATAQPHAGELPSGHPSLDKTAENISMATHSTIKTQKPVRISGEVRARWKDVTFEVRDVSKKATETIKISVGSAAALKGGMKLKAEILVPDYVLSSDMKSIETRSNEPRNPAVLVSLLDGDKTVARGWIFRNLPQFNTFNSPKYALRLVSPGQDN